MNPTLASRTCASKCVVQPKPIHLTQGRIGAGSKLRAYRPGLAPHDSTPHGTSLSVRVLVLAPGARLRGLGLRCAIEQGAVVRSDEWVGRHDRVGVVDGPVLARERDPARALA